MPVYYMLDGFTVISRIFAVYSGGSSIYSFKSSNKVMRLAKLDEYGKLYCEEPPKEEPLTEEKADELLKFYKGF